MSLSQKIHFGDVGKFFITKNSLRARVNDVKLDRVNGTTAYVVVFGSNYVQHKTYNVHGKSLEDKDDAHDLLRRNVE